MKLPTQPRLALADLLQGLKQKLRAANRERLYRRRMKKGLDYAQWLSEHDLPTPEQQLTWSAWLKGLKAPPHVTLRLQLASDSQAAELTRSIDSVSSQTYPHWTLGLSLPDDASSALTAVAREAADSDARIHILASPEHLVGDWIGQLFPGDRLHQNALLSMMHAAAAHPSAQLIYPDEDQMDAQGQRTAHHFKPDWNLDLQRSTGYIGHAVLVAAAHLRTRGGFAPSHHQAAAYDTVLRCIEGIGPEEILHVPSVLWHGPARPEPDMGEAERQALQAHLNRTDPSAQAELSASGSLHVSYALPEPAPMVSIIICTRNQYQLLHTCVESILKLTDYPSYELIIVDNGSDDPRALIYLQSLPRLHGRIHVVRDDSPFNYAKLNNQAAKLAQGSLLALLNNDIEVIAPGWLKEMAAHACRPTIGCVGAKLLYPNDTVQHAGVLVGGGADDSNAIAAHYFRGLPAQAPGYHRRALATQALTAVTAACLVVRRAVFEQLGGLDSEHLAVCYNDVDFCLRVRELGLNNVWAPHALLYHHESISRGRDASAENQARFLPELAYMMRRWQNQLSHDPSYNPNLSHIKPDFLLPSRSPEK